MRPARGNIDSGFVALLAQDGVEEFQAKARNGTWLDEPSFEGTLVVTFGKLLSRWTGGRIEATLHRMIRWNQERYSVQFFYEPSVEGIIFPLPFEDQLPLKLIANRL